jgi:hypothetical protein
MELFFCCVEKHTETDQRWQAFYMNVEKMVLFLQFCRKMAVRERNKGEQGRLLKSIPQGKSMVMN